MQIKSIRKKFLLWIRDVVGAFCILVEILLWCLIPVFIVYAVTYFSYSNLGFFEPQNNEEIKKEISQGIYHEN